MKLRAGYIAVALVLFVTEVLIALFVDDRFVRPYLGDALAVVLMYAGLRGVSRLSVLQAAATALGIAFAIEFGQLVHVSDLIGLGHRDVARFVLGHRFEVRDLFTYVAGALAVLAVERLRTTRPNAP